ncbi:unnamed protein product [Cylicocyclus nassatus]|uniref:Uncharacterized protein n=1 Tax=Cylicocyclus nassatus TaxID=53992 RepID=A0AA36M612_CYLNA|nr:unnamed protein product [Cylicocyclus nassatus]
MEPLQFTIGPEEVVIEMCPSTLYKMAKQAAENSPQETSKKLDVPLDESPVKVQATDPKMPSRCWRCKASRLRVVNIEGTGKRLLECANRNCLASIEYTDLPAGTIIEQEKSRKNYGWYLRDTAEMFYPSQKTLDIPPGAKFDYKPEVLLNKGKSVMIRCPGQKRLVLLE